MDSQPQPWFRNSVHFYDDPAVMETGLAWAWPFILSALKASTSFGIVPSRALSDAVIYGRAQLPPPAPRGYTVRDAFAAAGLLVPGADPDTWTTPNWSRYQPDPTSNERVRAFRERNRQRAEEAARASPQPPAPTPDAKRPVTVTNAPKRDDTLDATGRDDHNNYDTDNALARVTAVVALCERIVGEPCAEQTAMMWHLNLGYPLERIEGGLVLARADHPTLAAADLFKRARSYMQRWTPEETRKGGSAPPASVSPPRGGRTSNTGRRTHHAAGLYDAHGAEPPELAEVPAGKM